MDRVNGFVNVEDMLKVLTNPSRVEVDDAKKKASCRNIKQPTNKLERRRKWAR